MTERQRVVITGAAGLLGGLLRRHLETRPDVELVLLDIRQNGDPRIHVADLAGRDRSWRERLAGADAVVHLAADPRVDAPRPSVRRNNVVATMAILDAAIDAGVRRFVFASSNWVMAGYRDAAGPIACDLPERPEGAYGFGKAFGESLLRRAATRGELSVVVLRIGCVLSPDRSPDDLDPWYRQMWLGHRDWCHIADRAIRSVGIDFCIVNAVSRNHGSRWTLDEARDVLGYDPLEGLGARGGPEPPSDPAPPRAAGGFLARMRRRLARLRRRSPRDPG